MDDELPPPFEIPADLNPIEDDQIPPRISQSAEGKNTPSKPEEDPVTQHFMIHNMSANFYHRDQQDRVLVWTNKLAAAMEVKRLNQAAQSEDHQVLVMGEDKWRLFQQEMSYRLADLPQPKKQASPPALWLHAAARPSPLLALLHQEVKLARRPHSALKVAVLPGVDAAHFHATLKAEVSTSQRFDPNVVVQKASNGQACYVHQVRYDRARQDVCFACPLSLLRPATKHTETLVLLLDADTGIPVCEEWALRQFKVPPKQCAVCGQQEAVSRCGGCGVLPYCNKSCQRKHWKSGHKAECAEVKAIKQLVSVPAGPVTAGS